MNRCEFCGIKCQSDVSAYCSERCYQSYQSERLKK